jgi:hypothetical protein
MFIPKYVLEDLTIDSGSIIGKGSIKEFFNHVSMHKDVEDRSLAELAPSFFFEQNGQFCLILLKK